MRQYQLIYYQSDGTIEMYDLKNRRTFLKRCDYPSVTLRDLYVGGIITVYSRQLKIVGYSDSFTSNIFQNKAQMTVAVVMPDAVMEVGKVIDAIYREGLLIHELRMVALNSAQAAQFYAAQKGQPNYSELVSFMSSGPAVAMLLKAEDAVGKWQSIIGDANPAQAAPGTIRSQLGRDPIRNAVHGSDNLEIAQMEADFFFGSNSSVKTAPASFSKCSLMMIRPHAVHAGYCGQMIDQVLNSGFQMTTMQMMHLSRPNAEEFLEVYKGIVPEHHDWVEELVSGKCLAAEVYYTADPDHTVLAFRELAGASDPEIASHLHKNSLRARFGETKVKNAVHATDLPEDGQLEVEYFFNILQKE